MRTLSGASWVTHARATSRSSWLFASPPPVEARPPPSSSPDGMAIDTDDNVWVALFRGSAVACFDPRNGKQLATIDLPASRVTSCAFGGSNLQDLYITTARIGLSEDEQRAQPHAGGVFCARVEARGVPSFAYGG